MSRKTARDLMIPRERVTFLRADQTVDEAVAIGAEHPYTRFPVLDRAAGDRVIGYVNFKEIIHLTQAASESATADESLAKTLKEIVRPVYFARPDQPATEMLRVLVGRHNHMAIVREADGRASGIITLEDVIEELVGELEDEFGEE